MLGAYISILFLLLENKLINGIKVRHRNIKVLRKSVPQIKIEIKTFMNLQVPNMYRH